MWSFSRWARLAGLAAALAAPLALSACTGFTPVYGTNELSTAKVAIAYGTPNNRLEQLIYQDLRLKLGPGVAAPASGGTAMPAAVPKLSIAVSAVSVALTSQTVPTAQTPYQITVSVAISLVDADGKTLFSGSRSETADYNAGPQVLANNAAGDDASKRAAHLLADDIRLTVLGALRK